VRNGAVGTHRSSNDRRFSEHCVGRTFLTSGLNVQLDTVWTLRRQSHRDRDELFMDDVDRTGVNVALSKAQNAFMASGAFSSRCFSSVRFEMLYIALSGRNWKHSSQIASLRQQSDSSLNSDEPTGPKLQLREAVQRQPPSACANECIEWYQRLSGRSLLENPCCATWLTEDRPGAGR
jgi:hypothetical protein